MNKDCFPDAKLKFVQEIRNNQLIKIELESVQAIWKFRKGVLFFLAKKIGIITWR